MFKVIGLLGSKARNQTQAAGLHSWRARPILATALSLTYFLNQDFRQPMRRTMLFIIHMRHVDKQEQRREGTHLTLQLSDQSWDTHQRPTAARPHSNPHLECHLPNAVRFPESGGQKGQRKQEKKRVHRKNKQARSCSCRHASPNSPNPALTHVTVPWCQHNVGRAPSQSLLDMQLVPDKCIKITRKDAQPLH